jgi:hypothetical protein
MQKVKLLILIIEESNERHLIEHKFAVVKKWDEFDNVLFCSKDFMEGLDPRIYPNGSAVSFVIEDNFVKEKRRGIFPIVCWSKI